MSCCFCKFIAVSRRACERVGLASRCYYYTVVSALTLACDNPRYLAFVYYNIGYGIVDYTGVLRCISPERVHYVVGLVGGGKDTSASLGLQLYPESLK